MLLTVSYKSKHNQIQVMPSEFPGVGKVVNLLLPSVYHNSSYPM